MSAVFLRARTDLRSRAAGWLVVAVIVGILGGAVTAIAAGARRTDTAFPRFLAAERSPDIGIVTVSADRGFAKISAADLDHLPAVADAGSVKGYLVDQPAVVSLVAPEDDHIGRTILRKRIIAGRDVDQNRADEATISFVLARSEHLHVGDTLHIELEHSTPNASITPVPVDLHIVGIDVAPLEFPPQIGTGSETAWTTRAFVHAHPDVDALGMKVIRVQDPKHGIPVVEAALRRLSHGEPTRTWRVGTSNSNTQRSINLQVVALWIVAGLLALAALLLIAQLLSRQSTLEAGDNAVLRGLGMTRRDLWLLGMIRAVAIGLVGALIAVAIAIALSPLMPVGLARDAEPHPGLSVDVAALVLGAVGTFVLVLLAMAWPAARDARATSRRRLRGARSIAAPVSPAPLALGVRFATDSSHDPVPVPTRTTVLCAAVGVIALVTAFSFSSSLDHLLASPRLFGVNWDANVTSTADTSLTPALHVVERTPAVEAVAEGYVGFPVAVGRVVFDGMAIRSFRGPSLMPTPVRGRIPSAKNEVMLGSTTAATLHAHIGSTIQTRLVNGAPVPLRVVGIGAFPTLSDALGLGRGAAITIPTIVATLPRGVAPPPLDTMLVRFSPSVDHRRAIEDLARRLDATGPYAVLAAEKPVDLVNFGRVQSLPFLLAGVLAAFAALTLAHLLVTSIRRRRRDLAMLRAMGFTSRQLAGTVAALASTLIALALIVGVPLGLVLGRVLWQHFARSLGILARPQAPLLALALLVPAALLVANLVALASSHRLRRVEPATVLHTE